MEPKFIDKVMKTVARRPMGAKNDSIRPNVQDRYGRSSAAGKFGR